MFVNAPLDEVVGMADGLGLTMVQLHGDEGPSFCDEVARRTGARVVKAMRIRSRADIQALSAFRRVDFHLLDTHSETLPGGTGESFDWELVRARSARVPLVLSRRACRPATSRAAIEATRPFAVDVASGVEAAPGRKDPERLAAFFDAVRGRHARAGLARERAHRARGRAPLRPLRGPVRPRDADARAGRARGGLGGRARGRRLPPRSSRRCCATTPAARRRCSWPSA